MARQSVAWISFLEADLIVKLSLRKCYKIPDSEKIPTKLLLPGSIIVAIFNTFCVMPFDAVKTFFQKVNPKAKWFEAVQGIYAEAGIKGFFVGWRLRFLMYLLHAVVTVDLLEKLENWANSVGKE